MRARQTRVAGPPVVTLRIWKLSLTYKELLRAEQLAGITDCSRAEQNELTTIRTECSSAESSLVVARVPVMWSDPGAIP